MVANMIAFLFPLFLVTHGGDLEAAGERHAACPTKGDAMHLISFLDFILSMVNDAKELVQNHQKNNREETFPIDCADLRKGNKSSGVYTIRPRSRVVEDTVNVLCDMDDDGGGWTVIQRRGDFNSSKEYFYRDWNYYKTGFGDLKRDFWIGNDIIFALTNQRACTIKFVLTDWEGSTAYASYDEFWIDDEPHNYTVHVNGYRGTAGDSFTAHNGFAFTTKDRKNDNYNSNCAVAFKGAWWYDKCHISNLNGQYLKGSHETFADGVNWKSWREYKYSLKDTYMKIRPRNYNAD